MRCVLNMDVVRKFQTKFVSVTTAVVLAVTSLSGAAPLFLTQKAAALSSSSIVINEVSSNEPTEWIELYNKSGSTVDISGYRVKDAVNNTFGGVIPAGTTLGAHSFYILSGSGILNNDGDSATLYNGSHVLLDSLNFHTLLSGTTYGRSGLGGTSVKLLPSNTQGLINPIFTNIAVYNATQQFWYSELGSAVALANAGDTLQVHGTQEIGAPVHVLKPLTIKGIGGAQLDTYGDIRVFNIQSGAAGTTIRDLTFNKTDDTNHGMIFVNADNVRIWNNAFKGQFDLGEAPTSRGLEVAGGISGLDVRNNTFSHLRQPAYVNGASGSILNNYTDQTKGWVVVSESNLHFQGNSWGTNAVDIAIIKNSPVGADNYLADLVHTSNVNNNAVIEDQTPTSPVLTDAFVDDSAASGGNGYPVGPYLTITPALSRIVEGGRVHIANGAYNEALNVTKDGTQLIGESKASVQVIATNATSYGQGVSVNALDKVKISNITFNAPAGSPISYHFQAYQSSNLTLSNLDFNGPGKTSTPKIGGVDLNSIKNATLDNVSAKNYSKNGFSFTAQYAATDIFTRNVSLKDLTADNNNWTGIAFYTVGNDHSPASVGAAHNIAGVTFSGTNTITNNTKGVQLQGDSDSNEATAATPRYSVSGAGGTPLNLGDMNFSGNVADVINYQKKDVTATAALFSGKTGDTMTATERQAEDGRIFDQKDGATLGLVQYYDAPTVPTNGQPNSATSFLMTNEFDFTWDDSHGNDPVSYEFQSSQNPAADTNGVLTTGLWQSSTLVTPMIHSTGAPDGAWYWQVRAKDANNHYSAWSPVWQVNLDTHAPAAPILVSPGDNIPVQGNGLVNDWEDVADADHYVYQSFNVKSDGSCNLSSPRFSGNGYIFTDNQTNSRDVTDLTFCWHVAAVDAAGNQSPWSKVWTTVVDNTAPTVSIALPTDGSFQRKKFTITGGASDGQSDIKRVVIHIIRVGDGEKIVDGERATYDTALDIFTFDVRGLDNGEQYKIRAVAVDEAGNKTDDVAKFTVDNAKPEITIASPGVVSNVAEFTLEGTASDDGSGLPAGSKVTVKLTDAGGNVYRHKAKVRANSTWKLKVPAGTLADGSVQAIVTIQDNLGFKGRTTASFTVDNTAPIVVVDNYNGTDTTPTLTGSVNDPTATVEIVIDSNTPQIAVNNGDGTWTLALTTPLAIGSHTVDATATDSVGNFTTDSGTAVVTTPPVSPSARDNAGSNNGNTGTDTSQTVQTAAAVNFVTPQVLGTNTAAPANNNEGHVLGTETSDNNDQGSDTKNSTDAAGKTANLLGIAWYWWVLILLAIAAFLYGVFRRANTDDKTPSNTK